MSPPNTKRSGLSEILIADCRNRSHRGSLVTSWSSVPTAHAESEVIAPINQMTLGFMTILPLDVVLQRHGHLLDVANTKGGLEPHVQWLVRQRRGEQGLLDLGCGDQPGRKAERGLAGALRDAVLVVPVGEL